jgi:serine/threonine protein kinase
MRAAVRRVEPGPPVGIACGPYRLSERIARGGMADIFRAELAAGSPGDSPKVCAIKRLRPDLAVSPELEHMLADEARITSLLQHPNIVRVHGFGHSDGTPYLAMEHLDGCSLAEVLDLLGQRAEALAPQLSAHITAEVARALAYTHAASDELGRPLSIVHRDVSPGNIMLLRTGAVKLVDFGIARAARHLRQTFTQADVIKGKASYMAPEQVRRAPLDGRTDVFSLGLVLWELLAGRPLFQGAGPLATAALIVTADVQHPSAVRAGVSAELEAIAMRAIERDPANRYQTAAAMALDLDRWASGRPDPRPTLAALVTQASSYDRARLSSIPPPASTVLRRETSVTVVIPGPESERARSALDTTELELAPLVWTPAERPAPPSGGALRLRSLAALAIGCSLAVLVSSWQTRDNAAPLLPPPSARSGAAVMIVALPAPAAVTSTSPPAAHQAPPTPMRQVRSARRSTGRTRLLVKQRTPKPAKRARKGRGHRGH